MAHRTTKSTGRASDARGTLFSLMLFACALTSYAAPPTTVVASGLGVDEEKATQQALRNAVQQAVGVFLDAETIVENNELIKDQILDYSAGFVESFDKKSVTKAGELFEVTVLAKVRRDQLRGKLTAAITAKESVDGRGLFHVATTMREQSTKAAQLLADVGLDFPEKAIEISVAPPRVTQTYDDDTVEFELDCRFSYVPETLDRLLRALGAVAVEVIPVTDLETVIPTRAYRRGQGGAAAWDPFRIGRTGILVRTQSGIKMYCLRPRHYWMLIGGFLSGEAWIPSGRGLEQFPPRIVFTFFSGTGETVERRTYEAFLGVEGDGSPGMYGNYLHFRTFGAGLLACAYTGTQNNYRLQSFGVTSDARNLSKALGPKGNRVEGFTPPPDGELGKKHLAAVLDVGTPRTQTYKFRLPLELVKDVMTIEARYESPLKDAVLRNDD